MNGTTIDKDAIDEGFTADANQKAQKIWKEHSVTFR